VAADLRRMAAEQKKQKDKEAEEAEDRKSWVFICYQDFPDYLAKYNQGKRMHGYFKVVQTATCYEFTIMECKLDGPGWQNAVANKEVWRFPLEVKMGEKDTKFEFVTPNKIHVINQ